MLTCQSASKGGTPYDEVVDTMKKDSLATDVLAQRRCH